jgi:predicted ribosome quality control (RQC) complex YloA/Tae2 family protein
MVDEPPAPAKDRFTSLDTLALVRELRTLGRAHVDKVFDAGTESYALTLRARGEGRYELRFALGRYGALLRPPGAHADELSSLAKELRRHLTGATIASVAEPGGERYLEVELTRGDLEEPLLVAVELFGRGNLLLARGGRLLAVAHPRAWAHRTLRAGEPYSRPPSRANPWNLGAPELEGVLHGSRTDRVTTLAARLALGGPVAEEILTRAGLSATEPAAHEPEAAAPRLRRAMDELLGELGERPRGFLYLREGIAFDVEPYRSARWSASDGVERREHATFSEAAELFFRTLATPSAPPPATAARTEELIRQKARQEAAIAELESQVALHRAQADVIYANYADAEQALKEAEPPTNGERAILEVQIGELTVPLWRDRPLVESAQALYEEAKRAQGKLAGARAALAETEERLKDEAATASIAASRAGRPRDAAAEHRPRLWFEAWRWFLSSEGVLVLAGKDAASNDRIVRRYLGQRDLYVHADIHGAPSVVVKRSAPGAGEAGDATLREAGQFGLSFSKAWRAGLAAGDAFWVAADQVSKAARSGEFVPRGAFVIHGTKNPLKDLPLELGVGTLEHEGRTFYSVAPPAALRARGELRFLVTPGEERERAARETELARALEVSRGLLQPLLPAGGLSFRRA